MNTVAVLAMDIHKKFSKAVAMDDKLQILDEWRIDHGDREVMAEFFRHFEGKTDVVMEATFNWPWIADVATAMGLSPHLAHAQRAREMVKGMAKSDRKDAIFLGKLFLAGGNVFPESYLAPPHVRHMRSLFRQRLLLVRMRVAVKTPSMVSSSGPAWLSTRSPPTSSPSRDGHCSAISPWTLMSAGCSTASSPPSTC